MKKTIIILTVVLISFNLSAQSKDSIPKVDSANIPFLSINDINRYLQSLESQLTVTQYKQFLDIFNYMIATKQKELQQPKKK